MTRRGRYDYYRSEGFQALSLTFVEISKEGTEVTATTREAMMMRSAKLRRST